MTILKPGALVKINENNAFDKIKGMTIFFKKRILEPGEVGIIVANNV